MREPSIQTLRGLTKIEKILSAPIYKEELDALEEFGDDFVYNRDEYIELLRMFNKIHDDNHNLFEANKKLLIQINAKGTFGDIIFTKEEKELVEENLRELLTTGA